MKKQPTAFYTVMAKEPYGIVLGKKVEKYASSGLLYYTTRMAHLGVTWFSLGESDKVGEG